MDQTRQDGISHTVRDPTDKDFCRLDRPDKIGILRSAGYAGHMRRSWKTRIVRVETTRCPHSRTAVRREARSTWEVHTGSRHLSGTEGRHIAGRRSSQPLRSGSSLEAGHRGPCWGKVRQSTRHGRSEATLTRRERWKAAGHWIESRRRHSLKSRRWHSHHGRWSKAATLLTRRHVRRVAVWRCCSEDSHERSLRAWTTG